MEGSNDNSSGSEIERLVIGPWRGSDHIVFPVEICLSSGSKWMLEKRYSDFESLHGALLSLNIPESEEFSFPEKKWFGHSSECLDNRQKSFEEYLNNLIKRQPLPQVLLEFLELHKGHDEST
mmetsp:Transcript_3069/g.4715  ORF Transcript_3069/g.4715 Transcript_3069/m.4715 type:complete len:122 (-) Transcript_3069:166-531(-)